MSNTAAHPAHPVRHDDGTTTWPCKRCQTIITRHRGQGDVDCDRCGACYNAAGQQLRDDWRGNMSNYDDDMGDMEGFERQHAYDY